MNVRAWQRRQHRAATGECRVVAVCEFDLSDKNESEKQELTYIPFSAENRTAFATEVAVRYAKYGHQAPALRSIFCLLENPTPYTLQERYGLQALETSTGEHLLEVNSAELFIVRRAISQGILHFKDLHPLIQGSGDLSPLELSFLHAAIDKIWEEQRAIFHPGGFSDFRSGNVLSGKIDHLIPLSSKAAYISENAQRSGWTVAFNAGYYACIDEEVDDHHTFLYDCIGLLMTNGIIKSAPVYKRSALVTSHGMFSRLDDEAKYSLRETQLNICSVGLMNCAFSLPGNILVVTEQYAKRIPIRANSVVEAGCKLNPADPGSVAIYNRLHSIRSNGITSEHTPVGPDRFEVSISQDRIRSYKTGGGLLIPRAGFVISFGPGASADAVKATLMAGSFSVEIFVDFGSLVLEPLDGVQMGPQIIINGHRVGFDEIFDPENGSNEYIPIETARKEQGIPPISLNFQKQWSDHRSRIALGITRKGKCVVVMFEGQEPRTYFPESDSYGATMSDLQDYMLQLECDEAICLDGGGSSSLVYRGRPIARPADRDDMPFSANERLVPGAWIIK